MHKAAIAIVIPAYNAGRFLNEAIESVRAQSKRSRSGNV